MIPAHAHGPAPITRFTAGWSASASLVKPFGPAADEPSTPAPSPPPTPIALRPVKVNLVGADAESNVSAVSGLHRVIFTVVSPATDQLPSPHGELSRPAVKKRIGPLPSTSHGPVRGSARPSALSASAAAPPPRLRPKERVLPPMRPSGAHLRLTAFSIPAVASLNIPHHTHAHSSAHSGGRSSGDAGYAPK